MRNLFQKLWNDDAGFIVSFELMLVFVILLLGIIAGLTNLRIAVVNELTETGNSIMTLNQGYSISGVTGCTGFSVASGADDTCQTIGYTANTASCNIDVVACP